MSSGSELPVSGPLVVPLDAESRAAVTAAAELRHISISDYVRSVTVAQARREVEAAKLQTITLSPEEQLQFWRALQSEPKLTAAQSHLAKTMRGET